MFYTVINASKEQADTLYKKHCINKTMTIIKGMLWWKKTRKEKVSGVVKSSYSYDNEDGIGFVTLHTISGKRISYQFRGRQTTPMFVSFTGFGNIRYDISYPEQLNKELYEFLKSEGIKARDKFWKGGDI